MTGYTGYVNIDSSERAALESQQRESQNLGWMEHGFAQLGLVQVARRAADGLTTEYVWVQRNQDQSGTLPTAIVQRARAALAAEQSARAAYNARRDEALAYIAKHGLSSQAGQVHLELHCAEAWAAFQLTQKPTRIAMRDLGQVAERAAQLRAAITSGPRRIAAIEQQAAQQIALIRNEIDAAQLEMMQLGLG